MELNKYWDDIHNKYNSSYDEWLDKYIEKFERDGFVLELGCGRAYSSRRLLDLGFSNVLATDFSEGVLDILKEEEPRLKTNVLDMSKVFPIDDESVSLIISDLALHYFSHEDTTKILNEIYRVLKPGGYLVARVNSVKDVNHIPSNYEVIEDGFFFDGTIYKKFFDNEELRELLKSFDILYLEEQVMDRYEKVKTLIEFCVRK